MITTLYATSLAGCNTTQTASTVKEIAHHDILNYDASKNSNGEPITKEGVEDDNAVYCDCGTCSILTIFECIVISAIVDFFLYISVAIVGHCHSFYLKRREDTELARKQ